MSASLLVLVRQFLPVLLLKICRRKQAKKLLSALIRVNPWTYIHEDMAVHNTFMLSEATF